MNENKGIILRKFRSDLFIALGLTLLAWFHRTAFLLSNQDRNWPFTIFYQGDTRAFYEYALAILGGVPYDNGIPFHPPGFPYFLAMIYKLVGGNPTAGLVPHLTVKLMVALAASTSIGFLYLLVKPYLGRTVALVSSLLCLYHFGFYVISIAPLNESLYLPLLLLCTLIWSRKLDHPLSAPQDRTSFTISKPRRPIRSQMAGSTEPGLRPLLSRNLSGLGLGILLGILALTRAEGILVAAFFGALGIGGWWIERRHRKRNLSPTAAQRPLLPWALLAVGWILAVTPWTLYNAHQLKNINVRLASRLVEPLPTFVPITLYGPINLAMANHKGADGTFSRDLIPSRSGSDSLDITDARHLHFLLHGKSIAWDYMSEHPYSFLLLVLKKWRLSLDVGRLGWTQWNLPGGLNGVRRPIDIFIPHAGYGMAIYPFILLGFILCFRTADGPRQWAWLVSFFSGAGFFVTALFFGYVRQSLMWFPFWLTMAATGLTYLAGIARCRFQDLDFRLHPNQSNPTPTTRYLTWVFVLLMLIIEALGATSNRNYVASGMGRTPDSKINPDAQVVIRVKD